MTQDLGALSGSREPDPQAVPALSGFDPAREKNATLTLKLKAKSGYSCTMTTQISADQWGRIIAITEETPNE